MKKTLYPALLLLFVFSSNAQTPASAVTGGNNIQAMIHADGLLFQDDETGQFNVPGGHSPIRAAGIWIGGMDPGGNLKGAYQMYRNGANDFTPGIYGVEGNDWNRIWKVTGEDILLHQRDFQDNWVIDDTLESIFGWPGAGNVFFKKIHGFDLPELEQGLAPFWDENGNARYDPDEGDYPLEDFRNCNNQYIPGEMTWCSFHDDTQHELSGIYPVRMGIQSTVSSFRCKENLMANNSKVVRYKLINHANEDIDSCYFGIFVDFELGCPEDDYVASIPDQNTFFVYNRDDIDEDCGDFYGFGENPPAVAVKLLRGPLDENRTEVPLSVFMQIQDSATVPGMGLPETGVEFYRYLTGSWKDGTPLTTGGNGYNPGSTEYTNFIFPGHLFDSTGWSEITAGSLSDRRRVLASYGPFRLQPGAVNEIVLAFTYIPGGSLPGMGNLWQIYTQYKHAFNFIYSCHFTEGDCTPDISIPPPPPPPPLPEEFILSPNPANEWLKVEFRNFELVEVFEIYDALGRLVFETKTLEDEITVPVADFPKGTYFAVLKKKNERVAKPFLVLRR